MNRTRMMTLLVFLTAMLAVSAYAQDAETEGNGEANSGQGQGAMVRGFVDEDGDGFNDLAPDADGDGIPNALDEDFEGPVNDGSGYQYGKDDEFAGFGPEYQASFMHQHEVHREFGTGETGDEIPETAFGPGDGEGLPEGEPTGDQSQQRGDG